MTNTSELFPRKASTVEGQVDAHHDTLVRHGRKFVDHASWITAVHDRVVKLEQKDPSEQIAQFRTDFAVAMGKVRAVIWTFGIVWTVATGVGGIVLTLILHFYLKVPK